jgi:hypothetical protein
MFCIRALGGREAFEVARIFAFAQNPGEGEQAFAVDIAQ